MRNAISAAIVLLVVCSFSASASAQECECPRQKIDRESAFGAAPVVVWGKAQKNEDGELVIKVHRSYKGSRRKRTHKIISNDNPACDFVFQEDKNYVVFASKKEDRDIAVSKCGHTARYDHRPISGRVWNVADELPYGASSRTTRYHDRYRERLNDHARAKIEWVVEECDEDAWERGGKYKAKFDLRLDVRPKGDYDFHILEYDTGKKTPKEVMECLREKLDGKEFPRFRGGPVSVRAIMTVDSIDETMRQEKTHVRVEPYADSPLKTPEKDDDEEEDD